MLLPGDKCYVIYEENGCCGIISCIISMAYSKNKKVTYRVKYNISFDLKTLTHRFGEEARGFCERDVFTRKDRSHPAYTTHRNVAVDEFKRRKNNGN